MLLSAAPLLQTPRLKVLRSDGHRLAVVLR